MEAIASASINKQKAKICLIMLTMIHFHKALAKLKESKEFAKFKEENKDAYLCSAFFIIDYETKINTQQIDFFLPKENKICLFNINGKITRKIDDIFETKEKKLEELDPHVMIEVKDVEEIAKKEWKDKSIKKIFAVLQKKENNQRWNLTCITEGAIILKMQIDSETGKIFKKEERNLMDFIKKAK